VRDDDAIATMADEWHRALRAKGFEELPIRNEPAPASKSDAIKMARPAQERNSVRDVHGHGDSTDYRGG
jgi:hypothetical protein